MFSINFHSNYIIFYVIIGLSALAISWWSYRNLSPHISKLKKYLLMILRIIAVTLIGLLLLEPLLTVFSERTTGNKLGVVVDLSSSMMTEEKSGRRYQIASSAIGDYMPRRIPLNYYGFSDSLVRLESFPDSFSFIGKATNIATALIRPLDNDEIGALLIVTDGAGNIGPDPIKSASTVKVPVYSLVVGSRINRKDIFINKIDYPPVGYTNTGLPIEVEFGANGYDGQTVIMEIRDNKSTLDSKRVVLPPDGAYSIAEFRISVAEEGVKDLKAIISSIEDETTKDNNTRVFTIKFLKDKMNVLILSSSLNWEYTFLKKVLEKDSHFAVKTAIANRHGGFQQLLWDGIDLVIVMDLNSNALGSQINRLVAAMETGTGFLYLAGINSRGVQLRSWEKYLPVKLGPRVDIEFGEYFPKPTMQPRVGAILDIEGMSWEQLPPLKYVIAPLELNKDALIMMEVITDAGEHWPVVTAGKYKTGKTIAITGFPWWPRYFRAGIDMVDLKRIEKFWSNLVRWLVIREDLEKFNLSTDKPVYKLGEPVGFNATVFDDNYNLVSGARISVMVIDSSKTERELLLSGLEPGKYTGDFGSPAPGKYEFKAIALIDGDTIASANGSFLVEALSLEMENPSANCAIMEKIAEITGGKSYTPDNFSEFSQNLRLKTKRSEVFSEYRLTGNLYVLLLIILLFTAEWGIRKFNQLA
ncbi:MAG: hypothetical protein B6D58_03830 [candidate division Zixibacteria bacterium 4484_95]|nr:MAG: hypothetical protein B6D58_03830 [candidate division Zixibacteria bacterium 4484_95]